MKMLGPSLLSRRTWTCSLTITPSDASVKVTPGSVVPNGLSFAMVTRKVAAALDGSEERQRRDVSTQRKP